MDRVVQILPARIGILNQRYLPRSIPLLECFFSRDGSLSECSPGSPAVAGAAQGWSNAFARSLNANFCTFPVEVFGKGPNTTVRGTL